MLLLCCCSLLLLFDVFMSLLPLLLLMLLFSIKPIVALLVRLMLLLASCLKLCSLLVEFDFHSTNTNNTINMLHAFMFLWHVLHHPVNACQHCFASFCFWCHTKNEPNLFSSKRLIRVSFVILLGWRISELFLIGHMLHYFSVSHPNFQISSINIYKNI